MSKLQHLFKRLWRKIFFTKKRKITKPRKWCGTFDYYKEEEIPDYCQFNGCETRLTLIEGKQCKYCNGYFCINHIAPAEKHECSGDPDVIPHRFREIHEGGKIIVKSK